MFWKCKEVLWVKLNLILMKNFGKIKKKKYKVLYNLLLN